MYRVYKDNLYSLSIITPFRIVYLLFFLMFLYLINYIDLNSIGLFKDIDIVLGSHIRKIIRLVVISILPFSYISIKLFNSNESYCIENDKKYRTQIIDIVILSIIGIVFNFELILKDYICNYVFLKTILGSMNMLLIFYKIFKVLIINHTILNKHKDLNIDLKKEYEIIFNKTSKNEDIDEMKFVFEYYKKTS